MTKVYLFYGTQLVEDPSLSVHTWNLVLKNHGPEIYNGGWLYCCDTTREWYRCDGTPALLQDVPKELRALALLIT